MLCAGYPLMVLSQAKPESLVKERQAAMMLMEKYFYPDLRAMSRGRIPYNASLVARNAAYLDALSKMPWDDFTPNTRDVKSAAAPAVFSDTAKFKEAGERLQSEIAKLVSVSKNGDEAAVKEQLTAVDRACGTCHQSFRERR